MPFVTSWIQGVISSRCLQTANSGLSDAELQEIVLSHNLTPRKCLGFLTPLQALLKELGRDVQIRFA